MKIISNNYHIVFMWLFLNFVYLATPSNAELLSFEHLTVDNGLPDNTVRALLQDQQGYLWIGAHAGLIRYDGYEIQTFVPDPADSNSIGCRLINSLFLDRQGDIWIGSLANGVSRYSPATGNFTNFAPRDQEPDGSLPGRLVISMAEEPDGSILIGFNDTNSLARIDPSTLSVQVISPPPDSNSSLLSLFVDEKGQLWQGLEGQGVIVRTPDGVVVDEIGMREGLDDPVIIDIAPAGQGRLWFLGQNNLSLFDQRTRKSVSFAPTDWGHSTRLRFMAMEPEEEGVLWIAADVGLYRFSLADGTFTLSTHDPGRHDSLTNGPVVSLCRDRSGILWAGSWHAGLNKLDPQARKFSTYVAGESRNKANLPTPSVSSILVDKTKNLWVGTGTLSQTGPRGGLARLNSKTRTFDPLDFPDSSIRTVLNIVEAHPDSLWLGTNIGLWLCLPRQDSIVRPPALDQDLEALLHSPVRSLTRDSQGFLWVGTPQHGLFRINPTTGQGQQFLHDPNDPFSLSSNSVTCVEEFVDGKFWVGTDLNGLNLLDLASGQFHRFYDPRNGLVNVSDIVISPRGPLWLASVSGLLQFDPQTQTVESMGSRHGLPDGLVASVLQDREGHLWLSTESGLIEFDPLSGDVKRFDTRDGLPSNEACFAHFRTPNGTIYLGGPNGLVYFHPAQVNLPSSFEPQVVLTEVRIQDRLQNPVSPSGPSSLWPVDREINLPWNQSDFIFRFASLDFSRPERIQYRFMLENHDAQWRKPGLERKAEYSRLSPGQYRFRVKATNGDGVWCPQEATFSFRISPPWWATPWAWAIYAAVFVGLAALVYRLALRREKRRTRLGIRLAEARKIRELDQVKSRFFANISHEFRTPLTLIQGPLSRLEQDPDSGDPALFGMMLRNTQRLGQLINQLFDLSRLENKKYPLNWQPLNVTGLLKVLSASFDSLARSRGLNFHSSFPEQQATGLADADLLEKVVGNLLGNAIRYAPMGAKVWLDVVVDSPRKLGTTALGAHPPGVEEFRNLTIRVGNTGTYIDPQEQERIFDRFYQSPVNSEGQRHGSGIGLALIQELTDLLGGQIVVDSTPDEGTVFTAHLPLYPSSIPVPLDHAGTVAREASHFGFTPAHDSPVELGDERIEGSAPLLLVVEDDPDLRAYIYDVLKNHFRLLLAQDGDEGLEAAFTEVPDLIISDVMMPKRDGYQLCALLKKDQRTNHIPIILLTARSGNESRLKGLKTGADVYLAKPFDPEILLAQVNNLIDQRKVLQERFAQSVKLGVVLPEEPVQAREDNFLEQAKDIVLDGIQDTDFNIARFSRDVGMSRSQLHRKMTALTGMSASAFVRSVRLQKAAELLRSGYGNVTEVAMATGHQSLSNFSKNFRDQFGVNPSGYVEALENKSEMEGKG